MKTKFPEPVSVITSTRRQGGQCGWGGNENCQILSGAWRLEGAPWSEELGGYNTISHQLILMWPCNTFCKYKYCSTRSNTVSFIDNKCVLYTVQQSKFLSGNIGAVSDSANSFCSDPTRHPTLRLQHSSSQLITEALGCFGSKGFVCLLVLKGGVKVYSFQLPTSQRAEDPVPIDRWSG